MEMSPLSALAGVGAGLGGLFQQPSSGGKSLFEQLTGKSSLPEAIRGIGSWFNSAPTTGGGSSTYDPYTGTGDEFSDIRLKKNIVKIGTRPDGLGVYEFDYIWGGPRQVGLMAHEVQDVYPDAVTERDGYLMVNYSKV
jgi:hypothetical protein